MASRSERDRQLPLSVMPLEGEPLFSWVDRLAWRYRASRSALLDRLRLREDKRVYVGAGVGLDEQTAAHIARVSGLEGSEQVHAMTLRAYDGICLDFAGHLPDSAGELLVLSRREWAWAGGTFVCPACLAERDGAGLLSWQLPWHVACPEHGVLLLDRCPACGDELPEAAASLARQRSWCLRAGHCRARVAGARPRVQAEPCNHDLRLAHPMDVRADESLLDAQRMLLELLGVGWEGSLHVAGLPVSRANYFRHLRGICGVLLRGANADLLGLGDGPIRDAYLEHCAKRERQLATHATGRYRITLPRQAATLAALLPHAVQCLAADSIPAMAELLRGHTLAGSSNGRFYEIQHAATPPVAQALALARHGRLPLWVAAGARTTAARRSADDELQAQHVPALIWSQAWEELFADLLPTTQPNSLRQALSLTLARSTMPQATWAQVAAALDVPADRARTVSLTLAKRITRPELGRRLADALGSLRQTIEQAAQRRHGALIDYRQREEDHAALGLIDDDEWTSLCAQAGVGEGYGPRRLYASVMAWSTLTGRQAQHAPVLATAPAERLRPGGLTVYLARAHPALSGPLEQWCRQQLRTGETLHPWGDRPLADLLAELGQQVSSVAPRAAAA